MMREFIDERHAQFIRRSQMPIPGPAAKQSDGNSNVNHEPDDSPFYCYTASASYGVRFYGTSRGAFVRGLARFFRRSQYSRTAAFR